MTSFKQNYLKNVRFEQPDSIPLSFVVNTSCWHHYPHDELKKLMSGHPLLFPDLAADDDSMIPAHSANAKSGVPYMDGWGCVWETSDDGIMGCIVNHPLKDWSQLDALPQPDPAVTTGANRIDWDRVAATIREYQSRDDLTCGWIEHGHTFLRLSYIRGYENLLFDMVDDEPRLPALIERVESFNLELIRRFLALGVDMMAYPEDLGMQVGPMLSVEHFRRYIRPSYERLIRPARDAGLVIHMHSDGDIRDLVGDLIDLGMDIINLQDLVNGIDWIAANLKGRVCIDLDIDRQRITPFGTPKDIDALVREEVEKLGSPEGGLMLKYGLYPQVPLENVKAVMDAMERYAGYYS